MKKFPGQTVKSNIKDRDNFMKNQHLDFFGNDEEELSKINNTANTGVENDSMYQDTLQSDYSKKNYNDSRFSKQSKEINYHVENIDINLLQQNNENLHQIHQPIPKAKEITKTSKAEKIDRNKNKNLNLSLSTKDNINNLNNADKTNEVNNTKNNKAITKEVQYLAKEDLISIKSKEQDKSHPLNEINNSIISKQTVVNKDYILKENQLNEIKQKQSDYMKTEESEYISKEKMNETQETIIVKKTPEEEQKANQALVLYVKKNFLNDSLIELSAYVKAHNHYITRKIIFPDFIDIKMFVYTIIELFEFNGKGWKLKFNNFILFSGYDSDKITFKTNSTEKQYPAYLLTIKKLKLNISDNNSFLFIYDFLGENWEINIKIDSISNVNSMIHKQYKSAIDQKTALNKLKALFRPFLLAGKNHAPPEDLGGPSKFKHFLLNRDDLSDPITANHLLYYKNLIDDELEENDDVDKIMEGESDNLNFAINSEADRYIKYFDFGAMQLLLGEIKYHEFYSTLNLETVSDLMSFDEEKSYKSKDFQNVVNKGYNDEDNEDDDSEYSDVQDIVVMPKGKGDENIKKKNTSKYHNYEGYYNTSSVKNTKPKDNYKNNNAKEEEDEESEEDEEEEKNDNNKEPNKKSIFDEDNSDDD